MKKLIYLLLIHIALLSACTSPKQLQPTTPAVQSRPSQSYTVPATLKPTFTPTIPPPTGTAAPPSPTPTETSTPSPTPPPAGVFAIKFYPPLVLDYSTDQWIDQSEYDNADRMVSTLQNRELKNCTIGPMGPSGFYPENMIEITLGSIDYQVLLDQKTTDGNAVSYYFALRTSNGSLENDVGIAHFDVQSSPAESNQCRVAAEEVLGTLRRADRPKQS